MCFKKFTALVLTIIVFICHIIPGDELKIFQWDSLFEFDKLAHFILFGILSISYLIYIFNYIDKRKYVFYTIAVVFFYGLFLEFIQGLFFDYRTFDIFDLLADILGSLFFIFCFIKLKLNKYFNLD